MQKNDKHQYINPVGNLINLFGISIYTGFKVKYINVLMWIIPQFMPWRYRGSMLD